MAKAKLGTKRSCTSCGLRYYDLNKTPITCPSCDTEFDPESLLKTRKSRQSAKAANDDEGSASEGEATEGAATDLDQNAADTSSADNDAIAGDLDYDDDDNGDVDEESGGLIQDDISADDELLNNIPDSDES